MSTASDTITYMRAIGVLAATSAGSRIYVSVAPQSISTYPIVVMKVISMAPSPTQDSGSAVDTFRIQVDCYAKQSRTISDDSAFDVAHSVADGLRSAWSRNGSVFGDYDHIIDSIQEEDQREDFNSELDLYRVSNDYMVRVNTGANAMTLLASGTYTPTAIALSNVTTVDTYQCQYMRVGATVTVSGIVDVILTDDTLGGGFTLSLPIASALVDSEDLAGTVSKYNGGTLFGGDVSAHTGTNTALFVLTGLDSASLSYSFTFTYQVI